MKNVLFVCTHNAGRSQMAEAFVPGVVEDWDIPDPAGQPITEVRAIRDEMERRVLDLLEHRLEEIRCDCLAGEACHALAAVG